MIEGVNFSGPTFVIFNHFQHGPRCSSFKKSQEELSVDLCYWIGVSVTKMFQGPRLHFDSKYFNSNTSISLFGS